MQGGRLSTAPRKSVTTSLVPAADGGVARQGLGLHALRGGCDTDLPVPVGGVPGGSRR